MSSKDNFLNRVKNGAAKELQGLTNKAIDAAADMVEGTAIGKFVDSDTIRSYAGDAAASLTQMAADKLADTVEGTAIAQYVNADDIHAMLNTAVAPSISDEDDYAADEDLPVDMDDEDEPVDMDDEVDVEIEEAEEDVSISEVVDMSKGLSPSVKLATNAMMGDPAAAKAMMQGAGKVAGPVAMLAGIYELSKQYAELQQVKAEERTKRAQIEAEKETTLAKIAATKEMFMTYMDKSFDERKDNFAHLFAVVDTALEKDNMQALQMGLQSINQLAAQSPFKAIADMTLLTKTMESNDVIDI